MTFREIYRIALDGPLQDLFARTGFAESDGVRWRRLGSVVQVVRIEMRLDVSTQKGRGGLYPHVALSFDSLCQSPLPPDEQRLDSQYVHFKRALCQVEENLPTAWEFGPKSDPGDLRGRVLADLEGGLAALDAIDSPEAFVGHWWSRGMATLELVAHLHYKEGRYREAIEALRRAENYFSRVPDMKMEQVIRRRELLDLLPLLWRPSGA